VHPIRSLLTSSVGRKVLMALTGLGLVGFLVGHLSGNLLVFSGRDAINDYAQWLKEHPALVWVMRLGILGMTLMHVGLGFFLTRQNRAARPVRYQQPASVQVTFPARSMMLTGFLVLAFVTYHLLHFTLGVVQPEAFASQQAVGEALRHDVYGMVIAGFKHPPVVVSYVIALVILAVHLSHGLQSFLQSLGLSHARYTPMLRVAGRGVAALLVIGYLSIPFAVVVGWVQP